MKQGNDAFTLIELLIVISVIMILSSVMVVGVKRYLDAAAFSRAKVEVKSMNQALHMYMTDHGYDYPADVDRGMPPGIEKYLASDPDWPEAPWPGSYYDWDRWDSDSSNTKAGNLDHPPDGEVLQISIRFCELGNSSNCHFPNMKWAEGFNYYSSVYWCIAGPCRAHGSQPFDHSGCCMGGACPGGTRLCK